MRRHARTKKKIKNRTVVNQVRMKRREKNAHFVDTFCVDYKKN